MAIEIPMSDAERHWSYHPNMRKWEDSYMGGESDTGTGSLIGLVRVSTLKKMTGNPIRDPETVDMLVNDLKSGVGYKEPLIVEYNRDLHMGYLGEGNHRLLAAHLAGHEFVPTTVMKNEYRKGFLQNREGRNIQRIPNEKTLWPWAKRFGRVTEEHHPGIMHPRWVFSADDVLL